MESCYNSFALILVVLGSVGLVVSIVSFSSLSEIFFFMSSILSLNCLYLSSLSPFIFATVVFISLSWDPTESKIVCRNLSIFSSVVRSI